jgi:Interferon-induced transmembrane protein
MLEDTKRRDRGGSSIAAARRDIRFGVGSLKHIKRSWNNRGLLRTIGRSVIWRTLSHGDQFLRITRSGIVARYQRAVGRLRVDRLPNAFGNRRPAPCGPNRGRGHLGWSRRPRGRSHRAPGPSISSWLRGSWSPAHGQATATTQHALTRSALIVATAAYRDPALSQFRSPGRDAQALRGSAARPLLLPRAQGSARSPVSGRRRYRAARVERDRGARVVPGRPDERVGVAAHRTGSAAARAHPAHAPADLAAGSRRAPQNYLALAIVATILCCFPLGIVAIVKASQVNSLCVMVVTVVPS